MPWERARSAFRADGSLRDIYVHDVTVSQWQAVIVALRAKYPSSFSVAGSEAPFPPSVAALFERGAPSAAMLSLDIGGIDMACHFFAADEIEFDLMPDDVSDSVRFIALIEFMRVVAQSSGRTAELTEENQRGRVLLRATSRGVVEHVAATP